MMLHKHTPETFWTNVDRRGTDECWEWQGMTFVPNKRSPAHYGLITYHGKQWQVSRLAWALTHGDIPTGLCVIRTCRNSLCCNPEHMKLMTPGNQQRFIQASGWNKRSVQSRERHAEATRQAEIARIERLATVRAARQKRRDLFTVLYAEGKYMHEIGAAYGLTESAVSYILAGKR